MCAESAQEENPRTESPDLEYARRLLNRVVEPDCPAEAMPAVVEHAQARALVSIAASLERLTALAVIDRATATAPGEAIAIKGNPNACGHVWAPPEPEDGLVQRQTCERCGFVRVVR